MTPQLQQLCLGAQISGGFVTLGLEARRRHLYVIGQTGTGKSTLLLNLIHQDLIAGEGLALLDPHGDLAEAVLAQVPTLSVANQYLDQLPESLQAAIFGNVGSMLALRSGATDARVLAEQIGLDSSDALLDLPNGAAWARLLLDGLPSSPIRVDLFDAPPVRRPTANRLIAISRMRFGRPCIEVEARISKFLSWH